jgi:hypothetical protein
MGGKDIERKKEEIRRMEGGGMGGCYSTTHFTGYQQHAMGADGSMGADGPAYPTAQSLQDLLGTGSTMSFFRRNLAVFCCRTCSARDGYGRYMTRASRHTPPRSARDGYGRYMTRASRHTPPRPAPS